jgi:hypothetical protein
MTRSATSPGASSAAAPAVTSHIALIMSEFAPTQRVRRFCRGIGLVLSLEGKGLREPVGRLPEPIGSADNGRPASHEAIVHSRARDGNSRPRRDRRPRC